MSDVELLPRGDLGTGSPPRQSRRAIYLFTFTEGFGSVGRPLPDPAFEARLALHPVGSIAALIGVVPIEDYCGAEAERRLADVAWLAPRIRRHGELVQWAMRWSPVFPASFGALYRSLESLTAFMEAHQATIAGFLHNVAGKEEWELRAVAKLDAPATLDGLACRAWPDWRDLPKGARYLRLCRDRDALLDFGRAEAAALVRDAVAELRSPAVAMRLQLAKAPARSSGAEPVARYAFLVPETDGAALRERVHVIATRALRRHVEISLSGPWPPFSFRPDLSAIHSAV